MILENGGWFKKASCEFCSHETSTFCYATSKKSMYILPRTKIIERHHEEGKNMDPQINIFAYIDYKKYLTQWREAEKKANPGLTHEYLSAKLQQKGRSFFSDIESGRKTISSQVLDRLIALIGLKFSEAKYFRALVGYGQSTTYEEKEFWIEQIIELNNTPYTIVDKATYSFYKEWYHSTIRALLDIVDIKNDYVLISRLLYSKVTPEQVRDSVNLLKSLGLIEHDHNGFLKPTQKILFTGDGAKHELLRCFQVANHQMLGEILKKDESGTHDSTQITASVSREGFNRIMKRIIHLRGEIRSIIHKDEKKANRVYKIAIHIYPESKEIKP
jgi:uncharacterized protein (TIGR02147 family)